MATAPSKANVTTIVLAAVLALGLIVGVVLLALFGLRFLAAQRGGEPAVAIATTKTPTIAHTPTATRPPAATRTPTRTATSPAPSPTAKVQATKSSQTTPAETAASSDAPIEATAGVSATSTPASEDKLPQTGVGLGTPLLGLALAGLATGIRRLRRA